jgi:hypothetical protein
MATKSHVLDLAGGRSWIETERVLRDSCIKMTRALPDGVPTPLRTALYDLRRSEPRKIHLLGCYPRAALICAHHGAPMTDVLAPVRELEAIIRSIYLRDLPGLPVANDRETVAQARLDRAQLHLAHMIERHIVLEAREAAWLHRDELDVLIAVLDDLYHADERALSVRLVA